MRGDVVSAVVNLHREGQTARPSVHSALAALDRAREAGVGTELVLVLDRPDESTLTLAGSVESDHVTQVVEVQHGDLGRARNSGAAAASGTHIGFLDGDDLWGDEWLLRASRMIDDIDGLVVLHPERSLVHGAVVRMVCHPNSTDSDFDHDRFRLHNAWTALSFARRELYLQVPFPPNRLDEGFGFEDWSWNEETLRRGIQHHTVPDTFHVIRLADDASSLKARSKAAVRSTWSHL